MIYIGLFFILMLTTPVAAAPEVYIGGKKYISIEDYKLERVRSMIDLICQPKDATQAQQILNKILLEYSPKTLNKFSNEKLSKVIDSFNPHVNIPKEEKVVDNKNNAYQEMQQMLEQLKKKSVYKLDVDIDPTKVKTLEIQSKK